MAPRPETDANERPRGAAEALSAAIQDGKEHLLLAASKFTSHGVTIPLIISALASHRNLSIRVIVTKSAAHFLAGQTPEQPTLSSVALLPNVDAVYLDEDEWADPWTRHSKILHIELRRWAHLLVIAPMSANLLAKVAGGLCDDLLTCVIRAWNREHTIIAAPAMNVMMWEHPITARQLANLRELCDWFEILPPQVKALACGDVGQGGMCDWNQIVTVITERLMGTGSPRKGRVGDCL
ncbi:hypothetical protein B7494_g1184 [Chlorociboria aeruginascens]|nr:hypothetical protein B7494_g1184 [Chlorociboria aeruginascens]